MYHFNDQLFENVAAWMNLVSLPALPSCNISSRSVGGDRESKRMTRFLSDGIMKVSCDGEVTSPRYFLSNVFRRVL